MKFRKVLNHLVKSSLKNTVQSHVMNRMISITSLLRWLLNRLTTHLNQKLLKNQRWMAHLNSSKMFR